MAMRKFHFLCRLKQILGANVGPPDELLTTKELARLLGVSVAWVEIGRCRGYGPEYVVLSPRRIRYSRKAITKFLLGLRDL
jgi:hypothetical protein